MKKIKDDRSLRTKLYYYFMVIAGPSTVFISSGAVTYSVYNIAISPLFSTDSIFSIFFGFILIFIIFTSWFIANSTLIYSAVIDPGSTNFILNSKDYQEKYSMFLSPEFISTLPKCDKCGLPKPPRCHHCSTCGRCHLKLDHHCVIIGKCVSLRNQQPFYVACHWATLSLFFDIIVLSFIFAFSLLFKGIYKLSNHHNFDVKTVLIHKRTFFDSFLIKGYKELTTLFIFDILTILLFSLFYSFISDSFQKVKQNSTTFELIFPPKNQNYNPYDLGEEENIYQVYGDGKLRLWWPKITDMCGFEWVTPEYAIQNSYIDNNDTNYDLHISNEDNHEVLFQQVE
ncbi:hypothetical protein M9Y10_023448 [Tritrichomonas musculus]|uniref:Palmitoyltransferase n=1 Tax=Tritrichomonas musculus TaxID=1915356 RepID=A0ABR2KW76_9EUKA